MNETGPLPRALFLEALGALTRVEAVCKGHGLRIRERRYSEIPSDRTQRLAWSVLPECSARILLCWEHLK